MIPKSCLEEGDLPTTDQLRNRIKFLSAYHGLETGFGNEVVQLIEQALQVHFVNQNYLKGFISNAISKSKLGTERPKLTTEMLALCVELTPQKLDVDLVETLI
jgi:hypothetical protein